MTESGKKLLDILFEPDEQVCVSPDEFGYMSIPVGDLQSGSFALLPQTDKQISRFVRFEEVVLVAMNPIEGARRDENVTAYRTFLVELDDGEIEEQFRYVSDMKMPYSACVFSGSKSLHYAITLDHDLPSEESWRFYAQWILNVMSKADQQTKNPSRGIRMAGNLRQGFEMRLIDIKKRIPLDDLKFWLSGFEGLKPKPQVKREIVKITDYPRMDFLPEWVQNELTMGVDTTKGRNNRWFAISYQCGLQGWDEDAIIGLLGQFFQEETDFSYREWLGAVKSGAKKARGKHE